MSRYYIFPIGEETNTLEFNVTKTIRKEMSTQATSNPVENGVNITDHIRINPARITFTGVLVKEDSLNPTSMGYEEYLTTLTRWRNESLALTVHYDDDLSREHNFFISNFSMDRDSKISDGWNVSMTLQQIDIVSSAQLVNNQSIVEKDLSPKVQELEAKNTSTKELTSEEIKQNAVNNILNRNTVGL